MNTNGESLNVQAKGTFWSIMHLRCPRCHHGRVFKGVFAMNERCAVCAMRFEREPGYFLGAMYISYAMASVIVGAAFILFHVLLPELADIWHYAAACGVLLPFVPMIFRYSRVMWMTFDRAVDG